MFVAVKGGGGCGDAADGGQQDGGGGAVVDNGDGTYSCSYTPQEGANDVDGGNWHLKVLLNGKHIVGLLTVPDALQ